MNADWLHRMNPRHAWPRLVGGLGAVVALAGLVRSADRAGDTERFQADAASARLVAGYLSLVVPADTAGQYQLPMLMSAVHTLEAARDWKGGLQVAWRQSPLLPERMRVAPLDSATRAELEQGYGTSRVERGGRAVAVVPLLDRDQWNPVGWVAVADTVPSPGGRSITLLLLMVAGVAGLLTLYLARPGESPVRRYGLLLLTLATAMLLAQHQSGRVRRVAAAGTEAVLTRARHLATRALVMRGISEDQLPRALPGLQATLHPADSVPADSAIEVNEALAVTRVVLPSGGVLEISMVRREARLGPLGLAQGGWLLLLALALGFSAWAGGAQGDRLRYRQTLTAWKFLAPALGHLAVFSFAPLLFAGWLALHRWGLVEPVKPYVGLANFREVLGDSAFWHSLWVTALYGLYVPATMVVALLAAMALDRSGFRIRLVRAFLFLPFISSVVAVALVWQWMYQPDFGLVNHLLALVGVSGPDWLGNPRTALLAVMVLSVWMHLGYQMVIFLAGLQAIPPAYHDAARVDGAGAWQRFRRITLPLLRPTILFVLVTGTIASFQVFTIVSVMTEGGPLRATDVVVYRIYQEAWEFLRFGTASAMSLVLLLLLLGLTWIQFRWLGRRVEIL